LNESTKILRLRPIQRPKIPLADSSVYADAIPLPNSDESTALDRSHPLQEPERWLPAASAATDEGAQTASNESRLQGRASPRSRSLAELVRTLPEEFLQSDWEERCFRGFTLDIDDAGSEFDG
jgi:hypothetical protein